ncbi:hypothetical protein F2Q69_00040052 [Brassica cretica]|uniref:Uncharacterized protein n=1 Tax=Brassica cretica TaxID=69181 RepID=A0A8S9NGQ7_BRACR|nr:hypothetical protein F2Q69_00040052 [Brassica cretica]
MSSSLTDSSKTCDKTSQNWQLEMVQKMLGMLQEADIGVGISGVEAMQEVVQNLPFGCYMASAAQ